MKRIKWENIAFVITIICGVIQVVNMNANSLEYLDIIKYLILAILVRYTIKYVRTNTKAFKGELKSFFKE